MSRKDDECSALEGHGWVDWSGLATLLTNAAQAFAISPHHLLATSWAD
jgi:hypothetical protein